MQQELLIIWASGEVTSKQGFYLSNFKDEVIESHAFACTILCAPIKGGGGTSLLTLSLSLCHELHKRKHSDIREKTMQSHGSSDGKSVYHFRPQILMVSFITDHLKDEIPLLYSQDRGGNSCGEK